MTDETHKPTPPTPVGGLIITIVVVIAVIGWILLGVKLLGISSFFASFLFFWYWAAVEDADLKQWLQSALGALLGLALAWQSHWLAGQFGTQGLITGLVVIVVAIYLQIMNWVPWAINRSAMLFLTVLAAPVILDKLDPFETAKAIALSALYFGGIVKLATMFSPPKSG
jgi:hypothetical protein